MAKVATMSPQAIEKGTGKPWDDWLELFASIGAENLDHKAIAVQASEQGISFWWAQAVTIAYEQHIGRRLPGQNCSGTFATSSSKTLVGDLDSGLKAWVDHMAAYPDLSGLTYESSTSATDKWRYWRANLSDGTKASVTIYEKSPGKLALAVEHSKIELEEQIDHWRGFWREVLKGL